MTQNALDWSCILGAKRPPRIHVQLVVGDAGALQLAGWCSGAFRTTVSPVESKREEEEDGSSKPDPDLSAAVLKRLAFEKNVWMEEEWRQAIGLETTDWFRRILLLCRAQTKGPFGKSYSKKFVLLPDGEVISSDLLWYCNNKGEMKPSGNPLNRIPDWVAVVGLRACLKRLNADGGTDKITHSVIAEELTGWLKEHGASDEWLKLGGNTKGIVRDDKKDSDIGNFRATSSLRGRVGR